MHPGLLFKPKEVRSRLNDNTSMYGIGSAVLSPQEARILQVIRDDTAARGHSPSVRRIARLLELRSPSGVHRHLKALERRGYLRRLSEKPAIIEVNLTGAWAKPSDAPLNGNPPGESANSRPHRHGLTTRQCEIGEAVGLTSTSSVHSQLEALQRKGFIRRDPTKPRAIEVHFDDPVAAVPRPLPTYVPLMSAPVAAGTGTLPEDVIDELLPLPRELVGQGELFMLQVRGDSMVGAGVLDRDYVVVRRQDAADNGDMVAALLPNVEAEATVKHFSRKGGRVRLLPDNPAFEPIDGDQAQILGKVVAVLRRLR